MQGFKTSFTVDIHDVDFNGSAKASSLLKYIQSAAELQLTANGMSYEYLKNQNRAFIVSKIKMEISDKIGAYVPITATTYPATSRGYSFLRCYELIRDGETVARAVAVWALVDTESRALVRVNDFELGLETYDPIDIPMTRIVIPKNVMLVGNYKVNYGDTDQNKHMNNTRYPDIYASFMPMDKKRIKSITISYLKEAKMGELLRVESAEKDGVVYFRTLCEDGKINTEDEIELADI
jgi:acyl-ACP thioesterase